MDDDPRAILLFDGVCNVCNAWVRFVVPRDRSAGIAFAPLQSEAGARLLAAAGLPTDNLDTVVLLDGPRVHVRSAAVVRVLLRLGAAWPLLGALVFLVPRPLRDAAYDAFARRRYAWFGRRDACPVPGPRLQERFLA